MLMLKTLHFAIGMYLWVLYDFHWTGWSSINAADLCSRGAWFESWLGHHLSLLRLTDAKIRR
jgi:hypothetical protein